MESHLPAHALAFSDLFARAEHTLRRVGYVQRNRAKAMVDWQAFAHDLGENFFADVQKSGRATILIQEPPRVYQGEAGWQPAQPAPIENVTELFIRGVCQVRHNIVHREKYVLPEGERSDALVSEAIWVLDQAIKAHPEASAYLKERMQR